MKIQLACAILVGAAMGLQATPVCSTTGNYAFLESLGPGGCTIGDKTFSDFTYSASLVPDTGLTFTAIDSGPSAIGFLFAVSLSASAGETNTLGVEYTVTGTNIEDAKITLASTATGSGATASDSETICPGHAIIGCASSLPLNAFDNAGEQSKSSDDITFAPVGTLGVLDHVNVVGGGEFASVSLFSDTVSQTSAVPEPGYEGVLAVCMCAVLMFTRPRKKTA